MADQQQTTDALYILGGIGLLGFVAWMASRQNGNTLQPTAPAPSPTQATGAPVSTNTLAMDMTALPDPLASIPSGAFGGSVGVPGMFVQTPSGGTIPFLPGISYALGSIIHYADGSVQIL